MLPNLSIVVPAFNEAENLPVLIAQLDEKLQLAAINYEIIVVDDGSTDATTAVLAAAVARNPRVKYLTLSRNFGHQAALNAGLEFAQGEAVITMDADLQHPPALVVEMYQEFKNGYDLVLTERTENKGKGEFKSKIGKLFYTILNKINDFEIRANVADFNLYSRSVVEVLKSLPEKDRFLRGLVQWVGYTKKYIAYEAGQRYSGKSKYTLSKMVTLAISGLTSFSAFPLRIAWWFGLCISLAGFCYGGYIFFDYFMYPDHLIAGWTSSIIVVLIIGGVQLIILAIMGEYLAKIFYEVKNRPAYIIKSATGFTATPPAKH